MATRRPAILCHMVEAFFEEIADVLGLTINRYLSDATVE